MTRLRLAATLVALPLLAVSASADPLSERVPILEARGWNGSDCYGECITDLKRQRWLALVPGAGGWTLVPTRLSFDDVETQGIHASVDGAEFFLSHPALAAGHAATPDMRFKGNPRRFYPGQTDPLTFAFRGRSYQLALEGHGLFLRSGARKTLIGPVGGEELDDSEAGLRWAGDLDGDGELDLIIDTSNTKNGQTCLLLSSANKDPHALVAEVGCQFFSG